MRVLFPSRVIGRHVGGNTTYARRIMDGLTSRGIATGVLPSSSHPAGTALVESLFAQRSRRGDVLHFSADTGSLIRTRAPSVVTVHGVASRWTNVARTPRQEAIWRFRVLRAIKSSDALITVSNSAADDIAAVFGVDRARIEVIPHGVDPVLSSTHDDPLEDLDLGIALPERFALYVGNLEPRKNLVELIRAFESKPLINLGIPLLIVGRPAWNYQPILSAINEASNVSYLGFVTNATRAALMHAATVFVFPSLYEGFGMPVLEAMAAGTPVAASRRGSLAEISGPAWELDQLDARGLSRSLYDALSDTGWQSAAKAQGLKWSRRFDWQRSIDRHVEVYEKVLRG